MSFFCFINIYTLRVDLSVALVAMVNTSYTRQLQQEQDDVSHDVTHGGGNESSMGVGGSEEVVCQKEGNETVVVQDVSRIFILARSCRCVNYTAFSFVLDLCKACAKCMQSLCKMCAKFVQSLCRICEQTKRVLRCDHIAMVAIICAQQVHR